MLHVRVVRPAALTEQLTGRLATAPGVQNMVTRAGAVRRPTGEAVESTSATAPPIRFSPPCASWDWTRPA
jgi:hypothetical protein